MTRTARNVLIVGVVVIFLALGGVLTAVALATGSGHSAAYESGFADGKQAAAIDGNTGPGSATTPPVELCSLDLNSPVNNQFNNSRDDTQWMSGCYAGYNNGYGP